MSTALGLTGLKTKRDSGTRTKDLGLPEEAGKDKEIQGQVEMGRKWVEVHRRLDHGLKVV